MFGFDNVHTPVVVVSDPGADGTMKISPIGDWDMRAVVENKLLNACIRAAAD